MPDRGAGHWLLSLVDDDAHDAAGACGRCARDVLADVVKVCGGEIRRSKDGLSQQRQHHQRERGGQTIDHHKHRWPSDVSSRK
jgi:hypothetical protein